MRSTQSSGTAWIRGFTCRAGLAAVLLAVSLLLPSFAEASRGQRGLGRADARFDMPDWISASGAASLDVGIDVLVPSEPPSPFSGEPAISASSGYYNLYWLIPGSPPTFLSITGEAGGTIPDYSKYDRNVQLTVNASVNGVDAYHDQTPIYDLVYWKTGGVVYSVESRNMTGTDSLSLANSLVVLTPPAAPEPTPTDTPAPVNQVDQTGSNASGSTDGNSSGSTDNAGNASSDSNAAAASGNASNASASSGPSIDAPLIVDPGSSADITVTGSNGATLKTDAGIFTATDRDSIIDVADATLAWEAPSPDANQTVTFQLVDPDSGDVTASAQSIIATDPNQAIICPAKASSGKELNVILRGSGALTLKTDAGEFPKNGINADFSPSGGGNSLSGTMPSAGAVKLDWKAPQLKSDGKATLAVTDDSGSQIGTCTISVAKLKSSSAKTPTAAQTSDGTDLRVTGVGAVKETASVVSTIAPGSSDDGSGMVIPVTPPPGSTPTPSPTSPPPTPTRTATPSVQPTATLAPTLDTSGMVSQLIGPTGGQLSCPSGATITIPAGALDQMSTVTLRPVANSKLPARSSVDMLPDTAFDITVAAMDGRAIDGLKKPAQFSIALSSDKWRSGATIYSVDGLNMEPLPNVTLTGDSVSAPVAKVSRYVAGVPVKATMSKKRNVAKLVMVVAALVFAVSACALLLKLWLGRKTTMSVGPRRLR